MITRKERNFEISKVRGKLYQAVLPVTVRGAAVRDDLSRGSQVVFAGARVRPVGSGCQNVLCEGLSKQKYARPVLLGSE